MCKFWLKLELLIVLFTILLVGKGYAQEYYFDDVTINYQLQAGETKKVYYLNTLTFGDAFYAPNTSDFETEKFEIGDAIFSANVISLQPVGGTFCPGESYSLLVNTELEPDSYEWQVSYQSGSFTTVGSLETLEINTTQATASGTYVYKCKLAWGSSNIYTNEASIIINSLTTDFTVESSSSSYCSEEGGVSITLTGSDIGVDYQLKKDGINSGSAINGSGSSLTWANQLSGTYSVVGRIISSGYEQTMTGIELVTEINLPGIAGTIIGSQNVCVTQSSISYSVAAIPDATSYVWAYSGTGVTIIGSGSSVTATINANATSGNLTVYGINSCGSGSISDNYLVTVTNTTYVISSSSDYFCSGSEGVDIMLSGSQSGVSYNLFRDGSSVGMKNGTGESLLWTENHRGTYTVNAHTVNGCIATINSSKEIKKSNYSLPTAYEVLSSSDSYCSGNGGVEIMLDNSGSENNVYQLLKNGENIGSPKEGVSGILVWGNNTTGTYTVVATKNDECVAEMKSSAAITEDALPLLYTVGSTSNSYCNGGSGVSITLSGSESGISYQLKKDGSNSGTVLSGTGSSLTWANQLCGIYTVEATNASGCISTMSGSEIIMENSIPTDYMVGSSFDSYCSGESGVSITLSGSESGVNYQLKKDGINSGSTIGGTGSSLTWANQQSGTYTVEATNGSGCITIMTGSKILIENPLPQEHTIGSSADSYYNGENGVSITLSGSESGISYQLKKDGNNIGSAINGTDNSLVWLNQINGAYTIVATSGGACVVQMLDSKNIVKKELPIPNVLLSKRKNGPIYNSTDNKLKFIYKSKYNEVGVLNYRIFNEQNIDVTTGHSLVDSEIGIGKKSYELNIDLQFVPGTYLLQIENVKNENWYLRFKHEI